MAAAQSYCCLKNPPVLTSVCGSGSVEELGGLKTYISGPSDSNRAVLLLSDIFGYEAPNLRKLADKIADQGFMVVVPDFLYGDPANYEDPAFDFQAWKKIHSPEKACEDAKIVIDALRSRGVTSVGVGGVCMGDVTVPTAFLGAEDDLVSPPEQLKQFGDILSAKRGINSMVKIFPGVSHGFGLRYDVEDESAVKRAEEAQSFMINWLAIHV